MRTISIPVGLWVLLLLLTAPGALAQETFESPEIDGRRLDLCLVWGGQCGKPAADAFCREKGFAGAREWKPALNIGVATPTLVLTDRRLCDAAECDGFALITCQAELQRLRPLPAARLEVIAADSTREFHPLDATPMVPWTTQDVIDPAIDVQAQYALMRMFAGEPDERAVASAILSATKVGDLAGIYREDRRAPALRARALGTGWWTLVPRDRVAVCVTEPAGEPALIAVRRGAEKDPDAYDRALAEAWKQCGLPVDPPRPYVETLPPRPVPTETEGGCALPQAGGRIHVHVYTGDTGEPVERVEVIHATGDRSGLGTVWTDARGNAVVAPAPRGRYRIVALGPVLVGEGRLYDTIGIGFDQPPDCRRNVYIPLPLREEPITWE